MSLPKILFITNMFPSDANPALGTFVKNSYTGLTKLGRDASVVALERNTPAPVAYINFYWKAFFSLRKFNGIAYVHYVSHSVLPALLARLANRQLKLALHFHGSDAFPESYERRSRKAIKKWICSTAIRHADTIIVPSSIFADRLSEKFQIAREKISVNASAGVDESIFHNSVCTEKKPKNVLFASRMIPGKGAITTANILKKLLADQNANFQATLVGSGPERKMAEEILKEQISGHKVSFIDPVDQQQLANYFQNADIFIFASTRKGESLGLVLIEAIFCGAVPIAFDNLAARSILGCSYSTHPAKLLAKDEYELQSNLSTLLNLSDEELRTINAHLMAGNQHYESGNVSRELSRILA